MSDSPARILVVGDDDDCTTPLAGFLRQQGYEVLQAHEGHEGVALAGLRVPDLVLMDVAEERPAGVLAILELRRDPRLAAIPVFVVSSLYTAIPGFRVSPQAGWLPHEAFFAKPVDLEELLARVRQQLAARTAEPPVTAEVRR